MNELKRRLEEALRVFQDETGLERGGPNLWPGTCSRIAMDFIWEAYNEGRESRCSDCRNCAKCGI